MTQMQGPLVALFEQREQARRAVHDLREAGFTEDRIGMITQDIKETAAAVMPTEESKWPEGVVAGGLTGASIGGLWALGITAGMLPAIGPIIAGGLLASVVASAAGGAAVGGIVGGLIGLGIPEEHAKLYETEFRSGRTIITVQAADRLDEAAEILRRNGGEVRNDVRPQIPAPSSLPLSGVGSRGSH